MRYAAFQIQSDNILNSEDPDVGFKANEAYFELRICEQFLRDQREYWNQYIPVTLVLGDFIYSGKRREIPFVVGPDLLKGL